MLPANRPILLCSDLITFSGAGQMATLDPQKMQNPANAPMLIDEVHFECPSSAGVDTAPFIFARMRVNRHQVCNYTPIWTLAKILNQGGYGGTSTQDTFVYRPNKPIYVPKYCNLQCDLSVDPAAFAVNPVGGNFTVQVAYRGRQLDAPVGVEIDVPWAASYVSPVLADGTLWTAKNKPLLMSGQNDLSAPFKEVLHVKSMIGRINYTGHADAVISQLGLADQLITLKMQSAEGAVLVRDPTPFGRLFDGITREWCMDTTLDPQSYVVANLQADMRTLANGATAQIHMAMHGYRTVNVNGY